MEAINLHNKQPEKCYRKIYNGLRRAVAPAISKFQFKLPSSFPHNRPTIFLYYVMRHGLMLHLIHTLHQNLLTLLPTYSTITYKHSSHIQHFLHTPNSASVCLSYANAQASQHSTPHTCSSCYVCLSTPNSMSACLSYTTLNPVHTRSWCSLCLSTSPKLCSACISEANTQGRPHLAMQFGISVHTTT